ncbi:uncharacterized protein PG998_004378 [Apiospora kogelbergensis]|uniref:uncharacterized protein n=1 Tax=Apiospora kogelbergensis TaxID=1337665 RepID=UPI00312FF5B8
MDQPTTRPVDGSLPESPWAQHFRPSKDPMFRTFKDGLHHSGLAPYIPSISWKDLGKGAFPMDQQPLLSMDQLDELFYSERYQRYSRAGVMSWRVDALAGSLNDLSDRDDIENDPNLIQVNEDGWLDFLRRDRWFDLRVDAVAGIPFPQPDLLNYHNRWWTVDNPAIWKYMRIALEVVNRTTERSWTLGPIHSGANRPPLLGREAGLVFEQSFFGGVLEAELVNEDTADFANGANTNFSVPRWPQNYDCTGMIPERWCPPYVYQVPRLVAPSLFATSLVSEGYWNTVVSHWGTTALRVPNSLSSVGQMGYTHYFTRWHSARLTRPLKDVAPEMYDKYRAFQSDWRRLTTWNATVRPWWEAEYTKWSLSPWSQVNARRWILEFREAHTKRDLPRCTLLLGNMISWIGQLQFEAGFDPRVGPVINLWGCIASLMMASIPIMAGEAGWKGPPLSYWMHPSVSASTRWTEPLTLHPMTLDMFQKKNEVRPGPWSDPEGGLVAFWNRFCPMGMMWDIPHAWLDACYDTYQQLWVHHYTIRSPWHWGEFAFEIPEYDDSWARISNNSYNVNFYNIPIYQWTRSYAPAGYDRDFYLPSPPSTPPPPWGTPGSRARQPRRTPSPSHPRRRSLYPVHFSTGEVGNNMDDEDFWVIESDGNDGYDIFSIRELCLQLGHSTAEMIRRELITLSPLGPKLREDGHPGADQIRSKLIQICPKMGKLLVPRTADEISEYDGQEGMPLWIVIGTTVYDITKFTYSTQREKTQLTENPGGRPKTLPDDPEVYDDLLLRLFPFRCALFRGQKAPPKTALSLFTPSMLRWHDNPTAGMYIAVDGIVYNVADYVDRHPGGRDIMGPALGREASKFHDDHAPNTMADYAELAVGRLVPDMTQKELQQQQLVIHSWVFDLSKLQAAEDEWTRPLVAPLGGKDASEAIKGQDATARALVHIYNRCKQAIVGRIASAELHEIPVGEVAKHDNPRSFHGAWVTVDGDVYDVTTLMLHGKSIYGQELPHMWAGQEVQDESLRAWLRDDFAYRVVGRAVPGAAPPEPTVDELLRRHRGVDGPADRAARAARKRVWGIDEDDPTLGGLVHVCSGSRTRRHNNGGGRPGNGPAEAARGRKRSAEAEDGGGGGDGDAAGPATKKRGMFDKI